MDTQKHKGYQRFKYSEAALAKALEEIHNGNLSLNKASSKYGIPKSTLSNRIKVISNVIKRGEQDSVDDFETVFNIAQNNLEVETTKDKDETDCDATKRIQEDSMEDFEAVNIAQNNVEVETSKDKDKTEQVSEEDFWKKHLHWPKKEGDLKKRNKARSAMPYAVTSIKWMEFHKQQEKIKTEKEENIRKRKLAKEQLKREKEANKLRSKRQRKTEKPKSGSSDDQELDNDLDDQELSLSTGDYVLVNYENKKYPGIIKNIEEDEEEYEISVMEEKQKNQWKWPKRPDQIWYQKDEIIKKICQPKLQSRGIYNVQV